MKKNYRITCLIHGIDGIFHIRGQPRDPSSPRTPSLISFHLQSPGCPLPLVSSACRLFHGSSLISYIDPTQENYDYPFNYVPSFAAGVTFVVLFSLLTSMSCSLSLSRKKPLTLLSPVIHLIQALHKRMWWLFPTVVTGGVAEIIGWSGRLWGSKNPTSMEPYLMQFVPSPLYLLPQLTYSPSRITTTIISPTFILAANFVIVGQIIRILGSQYSRLRPRSCEHRPVPTSR